MRAFMKPQTEVLCAAGAVWKSVETGLGKKPHSQSLHSCVWGCGQIGLQPTPK